MLGKANNWGFYSTLHLFCCTIIIVEEGDQDGTNNKYRFDNHTS